MLLLINLLLNSFLLFVMELKITEFKYLIITKQLIKILNHRFKHQKINFIILNFKFITNFNFLIE